jgi:hypothetical protein
MEHQDASLITASGTQKPRTLIQTITAVNADSVDFTGLSGFNRYTVEVDNVAPNTDQVQLVIRFSIAGSFKDGASDYSWVNAITHIGNHTGGDDVPHSTSDSASTYISVVGTSDYHLMGSNVNEDWDLTFELMNLGSAASLAKIRWSGCGKSDRGQTSHVLGTGIYEAATSGPPQGPIDGVQFLMSWGLIRTGTFRLYGLE